MRGGLLRYTRELDLYPLVAFSILRSMSEAKLKIMPPYSL